MEGKKKLVKQNKTTLPHNWLENSSPMNTTGDIRKITVSCENQILLDSILAVLSVCLFALVETIYST